MTRAHKVDDYADPVGIVEIAARLDVQRGTVDVWRNRGLLPDPDYTVGGRPAWEWATIVAWQEGRICPARLADGSPCRQFRTPGYETCSWHAQKTV